MKKKIALVGKFGNGYAFTDGQAVKCMEMIDWLSRFYGKDEIILVNTWQWTKHPFKLLVQFFKAGYSCLNLLLLPAQHGIKVFAPLACMIKGLFHCSIHYIVTGGWLPDMVEKDRFLLTCFFRFDGVYPQARKMEKRLSALGIHTILLPNFRTLPKEGLYPSPFPDREPFPVCTYSRIIKEKGIEDAVRIVRIANEKAGRCRFKLDIYGKVDPAYQKEFDRVLNACRDYVSYCGIREHNQGIAAIHPYFALLFPTYYEGEGFAGTILEAFGAGTPVIANDWKYNNEFIHSGRNGFLYPFRNNERAAEYLIHLSEDPACYKKIVEEGFASARQYETNKVLLAFTKNLR